MYEYMAFSCVTNAIIVPKRYLNLSFSPRVQFSLSAFNISYKKYASVK